MPASAAAAAAAASCKRVVSAAAAAVAASAAASTDGPASFKAQGRDITWEGNCDAGLHLATEAPLHGVERTGQYVGTGWLDSGRRRLPQGTAAELEVVAGSCG